MQRLAPYLPARPRTRFVALRRGGAWAVCDLADEGRVFLGGFPIGMLAVAAASRMNLLAQGGGLR